MTKRITLIFMLFCVVTLSKAKEGMWIPILLEKYNIEDMQQRGFKLTAEDVYSINSASMKDAIVIFNGGCTGEMISDKGLLLTNHHCGYSSIQKLSSLENNYLEDGFWAMSADEELPNRDLYVTFLRKMEDVTETVLKDIDENISVSERTKKVESRIKNLVESEEEKTGMRVEVKPFFFGMQYFIFYYEDYYDVRLVGTPPSSIGKFGGDLDNWTWPRHTGDFAVYRVYADAENKPADFSENNVPYKPNHFFPISLKGVEENDFTMIFGYPGSTKQYVPSYHISMLKDYIYPMLIDVRTGKLDVYKREMQQNPLVKIQYASKAAMVSNAWKKWQGEIRGLNILNAVEKKVEQERDFANWVNENKELQEKYGTIIDEFESIYNEFRNYEAARSLMLELIGRNGIEAAVFAANISTVVYDVTENNAVESKTKMKNLTDDFFKDYYLKIDKEVAPFLLKSYANNITTDIHPKCIDEVSTKYRGDYQRYIDELYKKSIFVDQKKMNAFIESSNKKQHKILSKDPVLKLSEDLRETYYYEILDKSKELLSKLDELNGLYLRGLMEFDSENVFYPDANFTLRVSYGRVKGYKAKDAVYHSYFTTLDGVIEKNATGEKDYKIPNHLAELYKNQDYGQYHVEGKLPVCFVATNHTTGGNSGSPIINGSGELIGINFDRAWEGVMSDMMFNPEQCRNISVDIRYILFIIDKFAGASYLIDEMNIIQ